MAHSIQVVGGKSAIVDDSDLMVIMGLSIAIIRVSRQYASLSDLAERWQKALRLYGPGTIDLELELIVENPTSKSELKAVFDTVARQVDRCGDKIPGDLLNEFVRVDGVIFYDYDMALIHKALLKLEKLIGAME